MNILVLNYEYPPLGGGAAPVCRDLASGMADHGHRVTVVTMGYTGLPEHEMHDGVEIYRLNCLRTKEHVCMPWEQYTYILAVKRFLKNHFQTNRYDVCHTHFIIPTGPIARWAKKQFGLPYIITAHGSDVEGHNKKTWMKIMHRILRPSWRNVVREASAVIAPSEHLLRLMKRELDSDRYLIIPNGLNIDKYRADGTIKEKRILLMGRMQESKNFQTILNAVAMIPAEVWNDWHVDILGDGPYREELEHLSTVLGMNSRVTFHGWVENGSSKQLDFLKRSAVYISASHFENCPMAVLEAIASGCYPLLSDIEGHRQFFSEGIENFFFHSDDVKELACKITELLPKGPETIPALELGITAYSLENIVQDYTTVLEEAAERILADPV